MTLIQRKINVEFDDVETTLKISFSTSLPNINVDSTLKQRRVPAG